MNEMRKLMEAAADLDFSDSEINRAKRREEWKNTWFVFVRTDYDESLIFQGPYEEAVVTAKDYIITVLDINAEESVIKKISREDGGVSYKLIVTVPKSGEPDNLSVDIEPSV